MEKAFDIVLFGATGFTGQLVAEYLRDHPEPDQRIALAGRTLSKLERVRDESGEATWGLLEADTGDQNSLNEMAAKAAVVCTTVGPYDKYGAGVVKACVENGAHYCDLTAEIQFIHEMIARHHSTAKADGVRIVHCCGFDSIPSDIGSWLLQKHAIMTFGLPCDTVEMFVTRIKGGFSGGTIATISNIVQRARSDKALRKILLDPYALNPSEDKPSLKLRDQQSAKFSKTIQKWTGPFLMAPANTRVVRRSNALMDHAYGREFLYTETMVTGAGLKGRARAMAIAGGSAGFVGAMAIGPVRKILEKTVLPASGDGPSKEAQDAGHFTMLFVGSYEGRERARVTVQGFKDPGYSGTAIMLAESAKCLAFDDLQTAGGVLTPSTAMGKPLVQRLRDAGMRFEVV